MRITYLGHAGFVVESEKTLLVADPWLSSCGAFDGGWMQLPQNHHLAPMVREKLEHSPKERFLYVSHEHKDHFDPEFLLSLRCRDFTAVIPRFQRSALRDAFATYGCKRLVIFDDGDRITIPGGHLRFFLEDRGLNRDSSLLVAVDGMAFLDLNDCKIYDRALRIAAEEGPIDVLTGQYSGASWHPVCYAYDRKQYEAISRKKMFGKFEAVARVIEAVKPRIYLASAGPVCFLDPALQHINFEPINVFPRAPRFFQYLRRRLGAAKPQLVEPMPGDVLDVPSGTLASLGDERVDDPSFERYVNAYAQRAGALYRDREPLPPWEAGPLLEALREELERKLSRLALRARVALPLYAGLSELPGRFLRVDFQAGRVEAVDGMRDESRYTFEARARDLAPVLQRRLTWEEFLLSLRHRMSRTPDLYDPILHGFLAAEAEDLEAFCDSVLNVQSHHERMVVRAGERRYSAHRYCPHQGADLTQAWVEGERYVICPRHRWQFDLENGGDCITNCSSIRARRLPDDGCGLDPDEFAQNLSGT